jgi:predicted ABC-type ATPase
MKQAKEAGYWVELYFMCLQDAEMNVSRVRTRHAIGGHDVPIDKIRSRYFRSMQLLSQSFFLADEAMVFNNSWERPELIAQKTGDGTIRVYPLRDKDIRSTWTKREIEKLLGLSTTVKTSQ